ncbi:RHS repeat-associated core domain [Shewanella putrefaciens]|nr:RHS repeat-associated core domain [Shewanella putrefaciens]
MHYVIDLKWVARFTSFVYGSDNMRAKQSRTVDSATTTTYYVDKYYEADSDGSWRAYLDDIAVLSYTSQRGHLLQFTLKDRLGSATTLADQNGNIVSQRYFDPFGRTASTGGGHGTDIVNKNTLQSKLQDLDITNKNRRGFTDHEHLNEQQLIHMNGRIYDYNLGRFMSVDPFIQSPTSTQSVNPYSYIMNNPLAGIDPTGYLAECPDRNEGCPKPEEEKPEKKRRMDGSGRGSGWTVIYDRSSNGSSRQSSSATGTQKTEAIGSPKQNANKQYPSYGNDANFAKGYGSLKGDMSGILSMTGPALAVDAVKAGIEIANEIADEYEQSGLSMSTFIVAGKAAGEAAIDVGAKKLRLPDVVTGGPHGKIKGISGHESHHMPADSVSPIAKDKGPAISMEKGDHRQTASWGNSREARAYRSQQAQLIQRGDFKGAQQMDINDVRSKFGEKYDKAINQMLDYSKTLD